MNHRSKETAMLKKVILVAAGLALSAPVLAHDRHRGHHSHHHSHFGNHHRHARPVVVMPPPRVYYAPRPVYVAPPAPVYYSPPPAPPSSGISIRLHFPL